MLDLIVDDVNRLRFVLAAQRDHYLPLKVIKDQLDALDRGLEPFVGTTVFLEAHRQNQAAFLPAQDATALRRLNNHAEAQEVCQEVFVRAMQKISQLREPQAFGSWLQAVASRMAINRAVRRGCVISTDREVIEATCVDPRTPLASALDNERAEQVRAGLERLRDLDRETLEAFYVRGQSLIEMADEFQSPIGTIKRRLHVARKRLARELEELAAA